MGVEDFQIFLFYWNLSCNIFASKNAIQKFSYWVFITYLMQALMPAYRIKDFTDLSSGHCLQWSLECGRSPFNTELARELFKGSGNEYLEYLCYPVHCLDVHKNVKKSKVTNLKLDGISDVFCGEIESSVVPPLKCGF